MKIGLVGYQSSGKSTLFQWLTGEAADPALGHTTQSAMASVPDERIEQLCEVYHPKKVVTAQLELIDTPGLSRTHEGSAARLGLIREADCLVLVAAAYDGLDPLADMQSFEEDLLLTDLEIVSGRRTRLEEQMKKPRPDRDQLRAEYEALEPMVEALEDGHALRDVDLTDEQRRYTRAFQLLTELPRLVVVNTADDEENPQRFADAAPAGSRVVGVPVRLEAELAEMSEEDRAEFESELGLRGVDRDSLLRELLTLSQQILFFTASEKEVRSWLLHKGGTAVDAAHGIHSDLARGFIRAETMTCDDLLRLGSEREVKAAGLMRQEPKDYVVQDGDILHIRFSV